MKCVCVCEGREKCENIMLAGKKRWKEGGKEREREREKDISSHLFVNPLLFLPLYIACPLVLKHWHCAYLQELVTLSSNGRRSEWVSILEYHL